MSAAGTYSSPLCTAPHSASRNQKTFCTRPPPIQSKWFLFDPASAGSPDFQTLWGWRRGNPVSSNRMGMPPDSNQSNGFARPLSGSRRRPVYPNISFSSKSFPFMTCLIALASLQASAFLALATPLFLFFRSYHAWMVVQGVIQGSKVPACEF